MTMNVYIRPLEVADAATSYLWRNNPLVWEHTGTKPDREITLDMENKWIRVAVKNKNEKRFAICVSSTNEYIGNVQLTNIELSRAEFHIFIGEPQFWGKGIGRIATDLLLTYAFEELSLKEVCLFVKIANEQAIALYRNCGFRYKLSKGDNNYMVITSGDWNGY